MVEDILVLDHPPPPPLPYTHIQDKTRKKSCTFSRKKSIHIASSRFKLYFTILLANDLTIVYPSRYFTILLANDLTIVYPSRYFTILLANDLTIVYPSRYFTILLANDLTIVYTFTVFYYSAS